MQDEMPTLGAFIREIPEDELARMLDGFKQERALPAYSRDCSTANPGDICKIYPCRDRVQLVLKCNQTKGCTIGEEYEC